MLSYYITRIIKHLVNLKLVVSGNMLFRYNASKLYISAFKNKCELTTDEYKLVINSPKYYEPRVIISADQLPANQSGFAYTLYLLENYQTIQKLGKLCK